MSSKCEMQLQGWLHSSRWGNDTKLIKIPGADGLLASTM